MIPLGGETIAVFHAVTQMRHVNDVQQSLVVDDPLGLLTEYRRQVPRVKLRVRQSDNGKVGRRTARARVDRNGDIIVSRQCSIISRQPQYIGS